MSEKKERRNFWGQIRCLEKDCGNTYQMTGPFDDQTSSGGCCKTCGSSNWIIEEHQQDNAQKNNQKCEG